MLRDQLEDGRIILNNIEMELKEIRWNGMNWIQLAPDRDKSRDLVKRVLKFGFRQIEFLD
jgi:hypothetical protein